MSDQDPNPTSSESASGDAGASAGSGGDGEGKGTQDADTFASEREALNARVRSEQGRADKAADELAKARAEIDKLKGETSGQGNDQSSLTADDVVQVMRRERAREREMASAVESARSDYPNADPAILADAERYDSAEALLAAVRASHDSISSHLDARLKEREEELRRRYAEVHGELPAPVDTDPKDTPTGDPTLAQLSEMSQAQLDELEARSPGVIDRVLRSSDQLA